LVKGHGEGSWTRVDIPFDAAEVYKQTGHIQVKGKIDHYAFTNIKLMPGSKGTHWLPVNEKIRKEINKKVGDKVAVVIELNPEQAIQDVPDDFASELKRHPAAEIFFDGLTRSYQKWFILSIVEARQEATRRKRIEKAIEKLEAGKKFHD
jgi:hypothetical protein